MDYQSLNQKTVVELRSLAKEMGVRIPAGTNKSTLIQMLLEADKGRHGAASNPDGEAVKPAPRRGRPRRAAADAPAKKTPDANGGEAKPAPRRAKEKAQRPAAPQEAVEKPAEAAEAKPVDEPVKPVATGEAPTPVKPEEKEAQPRAEEAAQAVNTENRIGVRGRMQNPQRPKPVGDGQQRQGRYQNWSVNRMPQGDARPQQRIQQVGPNGMPRVVNPRSNRQGEGRTPQQAWDNRDFQRRTPQNVPAATPQPENAQPAEQPERQRPEGYYNAELKTSNPAVPEMLASGECGDGAGVLELQPDGYGFLRAENCLPGPNDVYISIAQIRRFNLRSGDHVVGKTRAQREGDRYSAMMYITEVNGESPEKAAERPRFEDLVPIYPDQRLRLEPPEGKGDLSLRLIDMLAPIGKGQRGMIVSQPKAGKTTLLKKVANAITAQYPDVYLIVLLIDERPEEVTDMQRSIKGEVIYSTFDEEPEHHTRVSEMVLARAQRLVEMGRDVVVLLDSITRLARAYNLTITPTGRSLSGGLDPGALFRPKRFFGAARNIENGGSLTIIATALVETGSRMDDIIFEEFKGTGNMELHLDRKLSDRRVFPAIDLLKSGTRREELLLTEDEMNGEYQVRKMLGGRQQEMYEQLIDLMSKTSSNAEFFSKLKGWLAVYEKNGYTLGK
jgi:transcription termination factor Rho